MNRAPRYRAVNVGGCVEAHITEHEGGVRVLRSTEPLGAYPIRLTDRLEYWAREAPERTLVAKRDRAGRWRHISFRQMLERARSVGQALIERGLSAERPVAILSENDLEHLTLALGRDVGRDSLHAGLAGVFAAIPGLRQAAPRACDDHPRSGVRFQRDRLRQGD